MSTRTEVRVVRVSDPKAVKVRDKVWALQVLLHLEDGREIESASGPFATRKAALAKGARQVAEVGNMKAVFDDDGRLTFVSEKFKFGGAGLVVDWDDD